MVKVLKEDLLVAPAKNQKNMEMVTNGFLMDLSLLSMKHRLQASIDKALQKWDAFVEQRVMARLVAFEKEISEGTGQKNRGESRLDPLRSRAEEYEDIFRTQLSDLRAAFETLPEVLNVMTEASSQQFVSNQFLEILTQEVPLRRIVRLLVESDFINPVEREKTQVYQQLRHITDSAVDAVRLVSYQASAAEDMIEASEFAGIDEAVVTSSVARINALKDDASLLFANFNAFIEEKRQHIFDKLTPGTLLKANENLGQIIRSAGGQRLAAGVEQRRIHIVYRMQQFFASLLYNRSKGVLLAQKLRYATHQTELPAQTLYTFTESVSPSPASFSALPAYYRQIFLSKLPISDEFWVERKRSIAQAKAALAHHQQGVGGAVLVLGKPGSGKSAFCRRVASRLIGKNSFYVVHPPPGGSIDPAVFKRQVQVSTQMDGEYEKIFEGVPDGTAFIFHDLEMWWERSAGGDEVLTRITSLISKHGNRLLFLVNTTPLAYQLINRMYHIGGAFLSVIEMELFDAEQMQQAILLRHRSSGIEFEYDGKNEAEISPYTTARLFTQYFEYSGGLIGSAMHAWIAGIDKIHEQRIYLNPPVKPNIDILRRLKADDLAWLIQLALHKQLTEERFVRLFRCDTDVVQQKLRFFQQSGLITISSQGAISLNAFAEPFVIAQIYDVSLSVNQDY